MEGLTPWLPVLTGGAGCSPRYAADLSFEGVQLHLHWTSLHCKLSGGDMHIRAAKASTEPNLGSKGILSGVQDVVQ